MDKSKIFFFQYHPYHQHLHDMGADTWGGVLHNQTGELNLIIIMHIFHDMTPAQRYTSAVRYKNVNGIVDDNNKHCSLGRLSSHA